MLRFYHTRMFKPGVIGGSWFGGYGVLPLQVYSFTVALCKTFRFDLAVAKAEQFTGYIRTRMEW